MNVGKVPEIPVGAAPSMNSNHDNLVNSSHQALSHWAKTQWKEIIKLTNTYQEGYEGREQKGLMSQPAKGNACKGFDLNRRPVKILSSRKALGHPRFTHDTAGQHCLNNS